MKLYQRIIVYSVIAVASLLSSGCDEEPNSRHSLHTAEVNQKARQSNKVKYNFKNSFNSFGELTGFNSRYKDSPIDIETADLDGDGDLDIILADRSTGIVHALENRIPQKNKEK